MKALPLLRGGEALVDDEDWVRLRHHRWRTDRGAVVCPNVGGKHGTLHRCVLGLTPRAGIVVFGDGDFTNCQKGNLQVVTQGEHQLTKAISPKSTSQYRGVSLDLERPKVRWTATIGKDWKSYTVGHFATEWEAAEAYNAKAVELYGSKANLNVRTPRATSSLGCSGTVQNS
jgi:hypothetical protein